VLHTGSNTGVGDSFSLRHFSVLGHGLPEVCDGEDGVGAFERGFEFGWLVEVGDGDFDAFGGEGFGFGG